MNFLKSWKSYFSILLFHPIEAKIWLLSDSNQNYFLPSIKIDQPIYIDDIYWISKTVEEDFGIAINVLHYDSLEINRQQKEIKGIYVLEANDISKKTHQGFWCDSKNIETITFSNSEQKSIIETYLIELKTGNIPKLRPPWARVGWYEEASNWSYLELSQLGYEKIAPIECIKSWSISCVLKITTNAGIFYLKQASTLPLFCDEPVVTKELANLFPNHIPKVVSINRQHHWLLLQDFGKPIGERVSVKIQQNIYSLLAQIQIKSLEYQDRLLDIGCLDRRLNILQSQINPLIEEAATLSELSSVEISQLQNLAPYLKNLCLQLASYNIPETLVHGDLHLGNVAINEENYLFFDWTDSCITHPFFDLFSLLFTGNQKFWLKLFKNFKKQYYFPRLRDAYLNQWLEYESRERLLEAWNIAKPLCALHHAVTYQYIIATLEPRTKQEFSRALPNFLKEVITSASQFKNETNF